MARHDAPSRRVGTGSVAVRTKEKTKIGEYLIADDVKGVIGPVHMTVLEIHTWNVRDDDIERPNRIV